MFFIWRTLLFSTYLAANVWRTSQCCGSLDSMATAAAGSTVQDVLASATSNPDPACFPSLRNPRRQSRRRCFECPETSSSPNWEWKSFVEITEYVNIVKHRLHGKFGEPRSSYSELRSNWIPPEQWQHPVDESDLGGVRPRFGGRQRGLSDDRRGFKYSPRGSDRHLDGCERVLFGHRGTHEKSWGDFIFHLIFLSWMLHRVVWSRNAGRRR